MQTQTMPSSPTLTVWLEPLSGEAGVSLATLPLTIGRNDSNDLPIDSERVSREHAVIERKNGQFYVRDLNSTNGTLVNGERAHETKLNDGDLLVIADVEFTFRREEQRAGANATHIMTGEPEDRNSATAVVRVFRQMQEMLASRAVQPCFSKVCELESREPVGYWLCESESLPGVGDSHVFTLECRTTDRLRQLLRFVAVEDAMDHDAKRVYLPLSATEIGGADSLASLTRLSEATAGRNVKITAMLPIGAACDLPYFQDFRSALSQLDIELGYDGFTGVAGQLAEYAAYPPHVLRLAPALAERLDAEEASWEILSAIVAAAATMGSQVLLSGVTEKSQADIAQELGCGLAQGEHFGKTGPLLS